MHRHFILNLIQQYQPNSAIEQKMREQLQSFIQQNENCFSRELSAGHITGSAWLVNRDLSHVFMTHHKKLNRWFQPGGHSDGNANTLAVAMKEASEESGIEDVFIQPLSHEIFDIDIHSIPARKKEPEHLHYDIRFILEADMQQPLKISNESHDIKWVPFERVSHYSNEPSITRMTNKMSSLRNKI